MASYRSLLHLILTIALFSCGKPSEDIDRESQARAFYEAMSESNWKKITSFYHDSIRIKNDGFVSASTLEDYTNWVSWDSVFHPTYNILELEEKEDGVEVVVSKSCERILFLKGEPFVSKEKLFFEDGKIQMLEIVEYIYFDNEQWVANRDTLVNWISSNHPELNGFIFDQTKQGALNYLKAIDLFKKSHLPTKPNQVDEDGLKQGEWIYYYDEEWNDLETQNGAQFYRLVTYRNSKIIGPLIDYYSNGKPQMSIDSVASEDPEIFEGSVLFFSESGNVISMEHYENGIMDSVKTISMFETYLDKHNQSIPGHIDISFLANDLGYLYLAKNDYSAAEPYYLLAKEIREKHLESNEILYARSCNKLGYIYMKQEEYSKAIPLYERAAEIFLAIEGKESEYYQNSISNLDWLNDQLN